MALEPSQSWQWSPTMLFQACCLGGLPVSTFFCHLRLPDNSLDQSRNPREEIFVTPVPAAPSATPSACRDRLLRPDVVDLLLRPVACRLPTLWPQHGGDDIDVF